MPQHGQPHNDRFDASVVIPAYNEANLITGCLQSLADQNGDLNLEVVVVANGCTDNTAEVARAFTGLTQLTVVELTEGSKINALNAGDAACQAFPRLYVDADVQLAPDAAQQLIKALAEPGCHFANLTPSVSTVGSPWPVRAFWKVFTNLPYAADGAACAMYAVDQKGRSTFADFPQVIADDLFMHERFVADERATLPAHSRLHAPRRWSDLIAIRTRAIRGNNQLTSLGLRQSDAERTTTADTVKALAQLVLRKPQLAPHAVVYAAVAVIARRQAQRTSVDAAWERDESSRVS